MANSRISDLTKKQALLSNGLDQFADDSALVLLAREKSHNESIQYKDLKISINDYSVLITGNQNIAGEKTFDDSAFFKKDVKVDGHLTVQGDIFNLKFQDSSGQNLDQYLTNLDSNISVKGDSELCQNLTTSGDAQIFGDTILESDLVVNKESNFKGESEFEDDVTFNKDIKIEGNQSLSGILTVHNNAEFKKNVLVGKDLTVQGDVFNIKFEDGVGNNLDSYITDFDSNLRVKGVSTFDGQVTAKDNVEVLGSQIIRSELTTKDNALFEKNVTISGELLVTGLSTQTKLQTLGELEVHKNTVLREEVSVGGDAFFGEDVFIQDNINVTGDADLESKLDVAGSTALASNLDVVGPAVFSDTLDVTEKTTLFNDLDVLGNTKLQKTDITGDLTVIGNEARFTVAQAVFEQDVEVQGDLSIKGDLFNVKFDDGFGGNADSYLTDFDSNLQVKGSLGVTGDASLHSELNVGDTLQVTNKTTLMDELDVAGNTNLLSKLDVANAVTFADTLDVTKKTTLLDDLDVTGDADLKSKLDVAGTTALADTLNVTKKATLLDGLDVAGDVNLQSKLDVADAVALLDTLDVTKKTTLSDDLDVTGDADLKAELDVTGATALADTLDVTKKTTLSDDLDVTGDADLKSKLDVAGATALADTLDVTKDVSFGDNLSVENILQLGPRTGISQGYFNLYQDDPQANPGDGQFLSFKHKDQPDAGASGGLFLSEAGRVGINTYNENAMLNIEQPSSALGLSLSSQPSEQAKMFLYELGQSQNLTLGSGPLPSLSIPGVIPLSTLYAEKVAFVESIEQDLVIYATTAGTNVHVGAGDKKLLTFTGTTDSHPVSGTEAGNDVIFSADSNVGINVTEVALSPVTQDKFKLHVDGEVKIDGRLFATDVFETYPVIPKVGDVHMGATVLRPQNVYDAGDQGTLFFDDDYIFVCVQDSDGTDPNRVAWKRFAISEW